MKIRTIALAMSLAALPLHAMACNEHAPGTEPKKQSVGRESAWIGGAVLEVDPEELTITLAHDRIASLGMSAMGSMLIKAPEARLIAGARPGDRVRFRVALAGEQPRLTRLVIVRKS